MRLLILITINAYRARFWLFLFPCFTYSFTGHFTISISRVPTRSIVYFSAVINYACLMCLSNHAYTHIPIFLLGTTSRTLASPMRADFFILHQIIPVSPTPPPSLLPASNSSTPSPPNKRHLSTCHAAASSPSLPTAKPSHYHDTRHSIKTRISLFPPPKVGSKPRVYPAAAVAGTRQGRESERGSEGGQGAAWARRGRVGGRDVRVSRRFC